MKTILLLLIFSLCINAKTPPYIENVNPKSFSGLWYEIARTYNSFEKNCVASTVEYQLVEKNEYKVFNRCFEFEIGGDLIEYKGVAKALEKDSMSRLEMTYYWIFSKDYRVIYLNNYKSAVVTSDDLENVWIMNRNPFMEKNELDKILNLLKKYIDISTLIFTPQDEKGRYK